MPRLMINIVNGLWTVQIANVPDISYTFTGYLGGQGAQGQVDSLKAFANEMMEGDAADACLTLEVDISETAETAQLLFGTDGIEFAGELIFEAAEGATIMAALEEAGEALYAMVLAL